jgi:hypothetical protein
MYAQGRQTYPNINEEGWFTIDPERNLNLNLKCPGCEMIFQGTEFTVWQKEDG